MKKIIQKNNFLIAINIALLFVYIISFWIIVEIIRTNSFLSDLKHFILLFNVLISLLTYLLINKNKIKNIAIDRKIVYIIGTCIIFLGVSFFKAASVGATFSFRSIVQTSLFSLPLIYAFLLVNIFSKKTLINVLKGLALVFIILYFTESRHTILSFFNIANWISIDIFHSHSFTESNPGSEPFLHLFLFFYYIYKYTNRKTKNNLIFMILCMIFSILSFKRLALLFVLLIVVFGFIIKYNKETKLKVSIFFSIMFVILTYLYVKVLMGDINLGIDLERLTSFRSWFMELWKIKNYYSYGYGTSLFVIGRYLEMDLVQIYMELGALSLFIFSYSMFKQAGKRIYTIIIMLYVMFNLLTSSTMPYQLGWIMLGFNMYILSGKYLEDRKENEKTDKETISIIVPVYNVELYLKECVNSLVNQTYKKIEIILVDDGSKDKSGKICDELAREDSRISVFHKANGGLSDARNYGLKHATGKYVIFVDSDDKVAPEMAEVLYNTMIENSADLAIIDPAHFYNEELPEFIVSNEVEVYNSEDAICTMLYQKKFLVSAWGKIFKKEVIINNKFPVGMIFEDIAVMYKIFRDCKTISYNKSKLYGYRHRDDSITTKAFSKKDLDILKICDEMREYFNNSSKRIIKAVECYTLNANFRIYLNSTNYPEFKNERKKCYKYIKENSLKCILNGKVRKKLKIAILLFNFNQKVLMKTYLKVDRWK